MNQDPSAGRQIAEYAMALDLCSDLTRVLDEKAVMQQILDIFTALFAPQQLVCWVLENGSVVETLARPKSPAPRMQMPDPATLPVSVPDGFRLRIPYKDETIAVIRIDGLAFPEYCERYLALAMNIVGVCGLAVSNARTHHRLEAALSDLRSEYAITEHLSRELQVANEELEVRVQQRTHELETALVQLMDEVSQRKEAEAAVRSRLDEKTLLLRELDHRVKNNFQITSSILATHARKAKDPSLQRALSESRNRIHTIAAAQEKLLSMKDFSRVDMEAYVRSIVSSLFSLYRIPRGLITVSLDIRDVAIDINTAIPVGLVLNELISNSLRHGYPAGKTGEITVIIRDKGPSLTIICRDNGTGIPPSCDWKNPDTVGLVLVHNLIGQAGGTIEKEPGEGTGFIIHVQKGTAEPGPVRGTYNQIPG